MLSDSLFDLFLCTKTLKIQFFPGFSRIVRIINSRILAYNSQIYFILIVENRYKKSQIHPIVSFSCGDDALGYVFSKWTVKIELFSTSVVGL